MFAYIHVFVKGEALPPSPLGPTGLLTEGCRREGAREPKPVGDLVSMGDTSLVYYVINSTRLERAGLECQCIICSIH